MLLLPVMASRVLIRFAANVRTLAFKPRPTYQWRCLASTSAWRSSLPHNYRINIASQRILPVLSLLPVRRFASGTMTVQELEDKVQEVLRLFDKVDPEKVHSKLNISSMLSIAVIFCL